MRGPSAACPATTPYSFVAGICKFCEEGFDLLISALGNLGSHYGKKILTCPLSSIFVDSVLS